LNTTKTQETMPQKMELALMSFVHVSSVFVNDTMTGAERECPMSSLCVCHYIFKGAKTLGISAFQALANQAKGMLFHMKAFRPHHWRTTFCTLRHRHKYLLLIAVKLQI
jgi:hypothetical protein